MPVIVTVNVPRRAVLVAARVSVLVADAGLGVKDALTPLGIPEADRVTDAVKPFCGLIVIVEIPWVPRLMLRLLGEAARAKFGGDTTVRETVVE